MSRARAMSLLPAALLALAAAVVVACTAPLGTDYAADAGPVLGALLRGDLRAAFAAEPQMGQLSILLRWPAVELAHLLGADALGGYRAGAVTCLLAPVALAVTLSAIAGLRTPAGDRRTMPGLTPAVVLLAVGVLVANPVVVRALELGHPEEVLGATLCAAAVLLAARRASLPAGIFLGLALATKQWALLAIGPVFLAAPQDRGTRLRIALPALAVAVPLTILPFAVDPGAFLAALERPATGLHELRPGNIWSLLLGASAHVSVGGGATEAVTFVPGWLRLTAHPAILLAGAVLPLLWLRRRTHARAADALALLALVLLVRCAIDPWNHEYYHLPFLAALATWEVVVGRRAPLAAGLSSVALWISFAVLADGSGGSTAADVLYVTWALLAGAHLVRVLWWPRAALAPALVPAR